MRTTLLALLLAAGCVAGRAVVARCGDGGWALEQTCEAGAGCVDAQCVEGEAGACADGGA